MKVEIWSDIMCPFCYVGKKNFENALAQLPFKDTIEVEWKSFQLDPTLPEKGLTESTKEYLVKRKGMPEQQIEGMLAHLQSVGNEVGIDFRQDIAIPVNTFKAHRLSHFAQAKGKGNEIEEALFKTHFTEGKNIGNDEVLLNLIEAIGLDRQEAQQLLDSETFKDEVKADIAEAGELGISGVPFFVIDRKYGISGAQPSTAFVDALTQSYQENKQSFEMKGDTDNVCGPEGCEI